MDANVAWVNQKKIEQTMRALKSNNMEAYLAENTDELKKIVDGIVADGETVSFGGSMTLFETGLIEHMRERKVELLDRYEKGLSGEEIGEIFRKTFFADSYLTSTNAVTEKGELYNVDGNGNRVAAMIFGPKKVIVVAGVNKIVKDEQEARDRVVNISAPANAKRLNMNTPCAKTGNCSYCNSPDRICKSYTLIKKQDPGRIHVIFLNDDFGY